MKSNFSRRPTQPYAVQCDCDKKGLLTWASLDAIEIIKGDDDDDYMKTHMAFEWEQPGFSEQEMHAMNQQFVSTRR